MASLYELSDICTDILADMDIAETEEEYNALLEELDRAMANIEDKAEAYARIRAIKKAEAEAFKAEKLRLAQCQQRAEHTVKALEDRLMVVMERFGLSEMQTGIGKWRKQLNPPMCEVLDVMAVPGEWHIPQQDKIDCKGILKAYRETGEIPDGVDIRQTWGLRFR